MLAAVTGGGGRLGCSLVRALLERGGRVRVLEPGTGVPASLAGLDVELIRGSVLSADDVARLVEGTDVVFHLAAKVDLGKDRDGSIRAVNVDGTRSVAEAC
ncbi:MAG: NAD-dependent epimerase/dehydratase family protein, partial [Nevskia sp.]|nr:NAD-dependent epimerase/dehydratase family protein [Nevskia sp.]